MSSSTTPQGGVVVGGNSVITQGAGATTINQSSQRTAINWQSFDVGANAEVKFNQPSSDAIALNRVVGGDLSQINGRINANGTVVLINQSGVVFGHGSQVNAENVVVSTSNIATKDFMAGRMNFTGPPNSGSKIVNNGTITVKDSGLVGLIAPQVLNSGLITAQLGKVVLAGATAFTLDLYGDGLVSLDVTKAVRAFDIGGKTLPALVTNSGVIIADGGSITLTAQDADALVTQLIDAGGTIRANSVGSQAGTIIVNGVGGNIQIAGNLLARGVASRTRGGDIEALATGTVSVARSAIVDSSGNAGGGVIAIGTDLVRAQTGRTDTTSPKAEGVLIAKAARFRADSSGSGNGGIVTLLSKQKTAFVGMISARGGPTGGNGGVVEISSDGVISFGGAVIDTAVAGQSGEIRLDAARMVVASDIPAYAWATPTKGVSSPISYITASSINSLSGTIILEAGSSISVLRDSAINLATPGASLSLISGGGIQVGGPIIVAGSLGIDAGGAVLINSALSATGNILINAESELTITGQVATPGVLSLQGNGNVTESGAGALAVGGLDSGGTQIGGQVNLTGSNTIGNLGNFSAAGNIALNDTTSLAITGQVATPGVLSLQGNGNVTESGAGALAVGGLDSGGTQIGGQVNLTGSNTIGNLGNFSAAGNIALNDTTSLAITGQVATPGALSLQGNGNVTESGAGALAVGGLDSGGTQIGGQVNLTGSNTIGNLGNFSAAGNIALNDTTSLAITGQVATPGALSLQGNGNVTESGAGALAVGGLDSGGTQIGGQVNLTGSNTIGNLGNFSAAGNIALNDTTSLAITGQVATPGVLSLQGNGNVTESGAGALAVGGLDSGGTQIGGQVNLTGSNTIGNLGNFSAAGNIALNDTTSLAITGQVATPGALSLQGNGNVTESGAGALAVGGLDSGGTQIGGQVNLTGSNTIGNLGNFSAAGNIALNDTTSLAITGQVATPGVLSLQGNGNVTESGAGALAVGGLDSGGTQIGGQVNLTGSNTIGNLGNFSAAGNIALNDTTSLAITGQVATPGALSLQGNGNVTESGAGALAVGGLDSGGTQIGGQVNLTGSNTIGNLGNFSAAGNIALNDTTSLAITGQVATPGALSLQGNGNVTESGAGALAVGGLDSGGTQIGGQVNLTGSNTIGNLGNFSAAGNIALNDTTSLAITGQVATPGALSLQGNGNVTESGAGALAVGGLDSGGTQIGGQVNLTGSNTIGNLGNFSAAGNIALNDTTSLAITGQVATPGVLSLQGNGNVTESGAGALAVGGLQIGGQVNLTGSNTIGNLGNFSAAGTNFSSQQTNNIVLYRLYSSSISNESLAMNNAVISGVSAPYYLKIKNSSFGNAAASNELGNTDAYSQNGSAESHQPAAVLSRVVAAKGMQQTPSTKKLRLTTAATNLDLNTAHNKRHDTSWMVEMKEVAALAKFTSDNLLSTKTGQSPAIKTTFNDPSNLISARNMTELVVTLFTLATVRENKTDSKYLVNSELSRAARTFNVNRTSNIPRLAESPVPTVQGDPAKAGTLFQVAGDLRPSYPSFFDTNDLPPKCDILETMIKHKVGNVGLPNDQINLSVSTRVYVQILTNQDKPSPIFSGQIKLNEIDRLTPDVSSLSYKPVGALKKNAIINNGGLLTTDNAKVVESSNSSFAFSAIQDDRNKAGYGTLHDPEFEINGPATPQITTGFGSD